MSAPNSNTRLVSAALALVLSLGASIGAAAPRWQAPKEEPSKAAVDEAKALYVAGNRAVEQGRWSDALSDFERSYALSGAPAALFNVATTLRALGRHLESRDAFALLLERHGAQLEASVRKEAEQRRAEEAARVATLVLEDLPARSAELHVFVDGASARDDGTRPLAIELDPGHHVVRVEDPSAQSFSWEGTFADAERKTVVVHLASRATVSALPASPSSADAASSSSVWSSPILWGVVGVVVVGAAIGGGYWWHQSRQLEPNSPLVVKL